MSTAMPNPIPAGYAPGADLLAGRTVLVTGAGSGLGRATALAAAKAGATVILLGRTTKKLEAVFDEIEAAGSPQPAIVPMNLVSATWADLFEVAETIEREFGRLDGLVHCAAHFPGFTPMTEEKPKDWLDGLQVNLTAAYALTRHLLPLMQQTRDASIVFVTDAVGREPKALRGSYGVAKYALEGLVKAWSQELSVTPGLRMNSYDPGPMQTALRAKGYVSEEVQKLPEAAIAAPGLVWLLGPDSAGVNGQALSRS
jgi:NAD(P)-dependent dehydrogenase (short-subunit alcohol dehydrogenase family)